MWRGCAALALICLINEDISFEIVQYDLHKIVAESFFLPDFEKELRVRQQMLWFMNNLLKGSSFTNLTYLLAYFFT